MDVDEPQGKTRRMPLRGSKSTDKTAANDDDTDTASEDDEPQSDRRESEDEDELPPVRKPVGFGETKKAAAANNADAHTPVPRVPARYADAGDETDDDDEL